MFNSELKQYEGLTVADIARAQGKDGVDAFLDMTLADDLRLEYTMATFNNREDRMVEILNNKDMLLGLGDGGAHVDMLCDSGYPTYLLGTWVRERSALSLEEGVRRLTTDPADFFGIKDRGRLQEGLAGDIAIFDPNREEIISLHNPHTHHMNIDYNAYEGTKVRGFTETVLSRGRVIIDKGNYLGKPGDGAYIKRGPYGGLHANTRGAAAKIALSTSGRLGASGAHR